MSVISASEAANNTEETLTATSDSNFTRLLNVRFDDQTGGAFSTLVEKRRVRLRVVMLETGSVLRIEITSPDHTSHVFRSDIRDDEFKKNDYYRSQKFSFEFNHLAARIQQFINSMSSDTNLYAEIKIQRRDEKAIAEFSLNRIDQFKASPVMEFQLQQLTDNTLAGYFIQQLKSYEDKYTTIKREVASLKKHAKEQEAKAKKLEDCEQKYRDLHHANWLQKGALAGLQEQVDNWTIEREAEVSSFQSQIHERDQKIELLRQELSKTDDLESRFKGLHHDYETIYAMYEDVEAQLKMSVDAETLEALKNAHLETKRERDQLRRALEQAMKAQAAPTKLNTKNQKIDIY